MTRSIYFAGSISGGRGDAGIYRQIIELLGLYGTVLTEHVGSSDLSESGEPVKPSDEIYEEDMAWLAEADVLVAEVTIPSHGLTAPMQLSVHP